MVADHGKVNLKFKVDCIFSPSRIIIVHLADLHLELAQDASIFCKKQGTNEFRKKVHPCQKLVLTYPNIGSDHPEAWRRARTKA
jgi:hypothetical protein